MSDKISITGTVETVLPLQEYPSGFSKRVLVINTGDKYPQTIPVEFVKEKADELSGLRKGQEVTAWVNLRGNEHNGKYYASIHGWKLDKGQPAQSSHDKAKQDGYAPEPKNMNVPSNRQQVAADEDVPF